ncbi:hypothetical protein SERLA73DRAFT_101568 [Serpula lacrymans var. lacrymans S7.3]|uniref:E3 ubiquitin-protein ligase listerin n=2 Tax=Serpula lacrymans var. lacrymans TaxID=341189 RepID=F8PJ78_SERL3|nr:uncharacterized protein SERLADRAFT_445033 [Serpula lacrymans var. lacrymans S7.9]EGO03442.1 hypothetical protein SERLA73DRAFT_101568 [Serpula lacrymans var. lacrymans S7.3]EGO29205.1 hypothetical protein SERLADRAFT_445033 [Serpula lacrymans var. lacrymans S7.9]
MVKGQKSSASSGTRKKNARKAAGGPQTPEPIPKEKKPKAKGKGQKKEPKKKVYIPPVKPAPIQPDPLDTMGLVHQLPPELVVALRALGKKDPVTKAKAIEELQSKWVDELKREGDDSPLSFVLVTMLPVWLHRVPVLFTHPARRIRLLAASLHASLLRIQPVREATVGFIQESATIEHVESLLGTWCMSSYDIDRQVASFGQKSWSYTFSSQRENDRVVIDMDKLQTITSFIQKALLDPNGIYLYLNPVPPVAAPPAKKPGSRPMPASKSDNVEHNRSRAEGEEESEMDRNARLRVSAFGAFRWMLDSRAAISADSLGELTEFLCNPALWSSLCPAQHCPYVDMESFGFGQPLVRQNAWVLLSLLMQRWKGSLEHMLPILSTAVLRSAWIDTDVTVRNTMSRPLLLFLKEFPKSWVLDSAFNSPKHDADSDSEDSDTEEEKEADPVLPRGVGNSGSSLAYNEFLQFLELGCSGSPTEGYPIVIIILSTIPSSILSASRSSPLGDFFSSFWAALDGRALSSTERKAPSTAFLSSLLESMVFLLRRVLGGSQGHTVLLSSTGPQESSIQPTEAAKSVIKEQFVRLWDELAAQRLRVGEADAGKLMAQTLVTLNNMDSGLFNEAWEAIVGGVNDKYSVSVSLISSILKVFADQFVEETAPAIATLKLIGKVVEMSVSQCEKALDSEDAELSTHISSLIILIDTFGISLFQRHEFSLRMDDMIICHALKVLQTSYKLILAYLSYRDDPERCSELWHSILYGLSGNPHVILSSLPPLLDASRKGILAEYLQPEEDELDGVVERIFTQVLDGATQSREVTLIRQLLHTPEHFLSKNGFHNLSQTLVHSFTSRLVQALSDPLPELSLHLELIAGVLDTHPSVISPDTILPSVFLAAYLFPISFKQDVSSTATARTIWTSWVTHAPENQRSTISNLIKEKLRDLLTECSMQPKPEHIIQLVTEGCPGIQFDVLADVFPSSEELDSMLSDLPSEPAEPSLALFESLIPPAMEFEDGRLSGATYDRKGYSPYVRVVSTLLHVLIDSRQLSRDNLWALRHILALSDFVNDFLRVPSVPSGLLHSTALTSELTVMITKAHQLTTYLLTSLTEDALHTKVITALSDRSKTVDGLPKLIVDLVNHAAAEDTIRDSRILSSVLQHIFANATKGDADSWMVLARKFEKTAPQTSLSIMSSITRFAPEPSRLDRYRNELAANMLGISGNKVSTEGLLTLRKLVAVAPDPDSEVVFLPQQRAVNVMKACQEWITSDEEVNEEVESMMTLLFYHLAPILQNVPGSHWELVFDVIENNLEHCSISDNTTLVTLGRSLQLIIIIQDLVTTNKALRAEWEERQLSILTLVKNIVTSRLDDAGISAARSLCRELALSVIQDDPKSLVDTNTLAEMCHLLSDPSTVVQKTAYTLLHEAARKKTEYYVIEAAVDTEDAVTAELPMELLVLLQRTLQLGDDFTQENPDDSPESLHTHHQEILGYLLSWMVAFDLFIDASMKVRSSYFNHMRSLDIISTHFIPNIFDILDIFGGNKKAFKLDVWTTDEYYLDMYEPDSALSARLLAAHLYYRALVTVPALIRSWVSDCTDKQLLARVIAYTSSYFSPVIIKAELAQVRDSEASTELAATENLAVKVAPAASEVTASYTVDEHALELTLRMPSDWPLHRMEIRDTKPVGVSEDRWRGWVLGVQQIVWQQNGRVVDGLTLFTKNVTLHFAGQVECAICYSIISMMDGGLPQKPCKTCKNRFHAGCLYKWFKSSHSSSCPLCRSDIL